MYGAANGGGGRGSQAREGRGAGEALNPDGPLSNIMHAAYVGALEVVKSLVERGAPADGPDPLAGSTPLHWACYGGHLDVVRWLINSAGAEVKKANRDGCTPLFFACERGHLGLAQWLVREAGAEVNVKDDVMWHTPLHRVFLAARREDAAATDIEDLILWLIEAGADISAIDRFGHHVEELELPGARGNVGSSGAASKLGKMLSSARQEGVSEEETREKLKRRSAVRRQSGNDAIVPQMSPKLEAKQRAPLSRRGTRKDSSSNGSGSGSGSAPAVASPPHEASEVGGSRSGSQIALTPPADDDPDDREASSLRPKVHTPRAGSDGSGGGAAAPPAGAGSRMGGGPPAPAIAEGERGDDVPFDGGKGGHTRRSSKELRRRASGGSMGDYELQHQESLRAAEEALLRTEEGTEEGAEETDAPEDVSAAAARRRSEGAGTAVVEKIRELASEKSAGRISQAEFMEKKRQLLEMEQLRREAEEEALQRKEGRLVDAGAGILTSVGQNTPPPSPKSGSQRGDDGDDGDDDKDDAPIQIVPPTSVKDIRETYKASDIDRYTSVKENDGPRVFGEVPASVKESLAAKEAARQEAAVAAARKGGDAEKKKKSKKKGGSNSKKGSPRMTTSGGAAAINGGGSSSGSASSGSPAEGESHDYDDVNESVGGCKCVVM